MTVTKNKQAPTQPVHCGLDKAEMLGQQSCIRYFVKKMLLTITQVMPTG